MAEKQGNEKQLLRNYLYSLFLFCLKTFQALFITFVIPLISFKSFACEFFSERSHLGIRPFYYEVKSLRVFLCLYDTLSKLNKQIKSRQT